MFLVFPLYYCGCLSCCSFSALFLSCLFSLWLLVFVVACLVSWCLFLIVEVIFWYVFSVVKIIHFHEVEALDKVFEFFANFKS